MDKADLVIKSNAVFTGDGLAPFKGGVAVAGDRIRIRILHRAPL